MRNSPVDIFMRHLSLWSFPITPKYDPMSLMKIENTQFICIFFIPYYFIAFNKKNWSAYFKTYNISLRVLGSVSDKCPGLCKCLRFYEIWICLIFELGWLLKVTSTLSKQPTEHDGDGKNNKVYLNITAYFYPLLHVIIRLDGS